MSYSSGLWQGTRPNPDGQAAGWTPVTDQHRKDRLDDEGRCSWFEEWPYWPGRPHSARDDAPTA
jgi:hypothetical protein